MHISYSPKLLNITKVQETFELHPQAAKLLLLWECFNGPAGLVQLLLEFGADVDLRDHPGSPVLESEEVKHVGLRARPLDPDAPLKLGKLYFLVDLPRADPEPDHRRAGAGASVPTRRRRRAFLLGAGAARSYAFLLVAR
uniref:Uncharacterized protein n=1 Tax=Ananas comosus var. bracteatus TaxID=296719 RepID=A0A6V7PWB0_ANACO|nr:unnamed protein product [Ananas comosus var. bracteatus]